MRSPCAATWDIGMLLDGFRIILDRPSYLRLQNYGIGTIETCHTSRQNKCLPVCPSRDMIVYHRYLLMERDICLLCLLLRQDRCLLLIQDSCLLFRQDWYKRFKQGGALFLNNDCMSILNSRRLSCLSSSSSSSSSQVSCLNSRHLSCFSRIYLSCLERRYEI